MKKTERDRFNNLPHEQQIIRQPELLADLYKQNIVSLTGTLRSYANAFHNNMPGHDGTFAVCQHEVCVHGRGVIEGAELLVAGKPVVPAKEG